MAQRIPLGGLFSNSVVKSVPFIFMTSQGVRVNAATPLHPDPGRVRGVRASSLLCPGGSSVPPVDAPFVC